MTTANTTPHYHVDFRISDDKFEERDTHPHVMQCSAMLVFNLTASRTLFPRSNYTFEIRFETGSNMRPSCQASLPKKIQNKP